MGSLAHPRRSVTLAGNLVAFAREGFRWIVGRDAATLSAEAPLGHAEPTNAETGSRRARTRGGNRRCAPPRAGGPPPGPRVRPRGARRRARPTSPARIYVLRADGRLRPWPTAGPAGARPGRQGSYRRHA